MAAAAKDSDGSYSDRHVTFHQPMLIVCAWGNLQFTDTGKKKSVPDENIYLYGEGAIGPGAKLR